MLAFFVNQDAQAAAVAAEEANSSHDQRASSVIRDQFKVYTTYANRNHAELPGEYKASIGLMNCNARIAHTRAVVLFSR